MDCKYTSHACQPPGHLELYELLMRTKPTFCSSKKDSQRRSVHHIIFCVGGMAALICVIVNSLHIHHCLCHFVAQGKSLSSNLFPSHPTAIVWKWWAWGTLSGYAYVLAGAFSLDQCYHDYGCMTEQHGFSDPTMIGALVTRMCR